MNEGRLTLVCGDFGRNSPGFLLRAQIQKFVLRHGEDRNTTSTVGFAAINAAARHAAGRRGTTIPRSLIVGTGR